jgi:hypothetical protein
MGWQYLPTPGLQINVGTKCVTWKCTLSAQQTYAEYRIASADRYSYFDQQLKNTHGKTAGHAANASTALVNVKCLHSLLLC